LFFFEERVFIDTVGTPESYQAKLERIFEGNGIQFIVEKKADSKYASCSAASICAKVLRDELTTNWKWSEPHYEPASNEKDQKVIGFGSGYPSDPQCKKWMDVSILGEKLFRKSPQVKIDISCFVFPEKLLRLGVWISRFRAIFVGTC